MIATSIPRGIDKSMFFRLCPRAPRNLASAACPACAAAGGSWMRSSPAEIASGERLGISGFRHRFPLAISLPPFSPAPGPRSRMRSEAAHHVGIVLNHQDRISQIAQVVQDLESGVRCRGCAGRWKAHPAHTAFRPAASPARSPAECVVLRRRERVEARRSSVRYSSPTSIRKLQALADLLQQLSAMPASCSVSFKRSRRTDEASSTVMLHDLADILARDLDLLGLEAQPRAAAHAEQVEYPR